MNSGFDEVYRFYGFDDQFPIAWTDANLDEKRFAFNLGGDAYQVDKKDRDGNRECLYSTTPCCVHCLHISDI